MTTTTNMAQSRSRAKLKGLLTAIGYASFLAFLLVMSYRQGFSDHYSSVAFRSGSDADIAAAIGYEPENPTAHSTEGQVRMRKGDYAAAAAAFERAAALEERYYMHWLHLGYARQQMGQFDLASEAFERSIALAPNYSQPRYFLGMMLLDADRDEEAFARLSEAANLDLTLEPSIRRLVRKTFDDPKAIEAAIRPVTPEAKRSVARYLIKYGYMTDTVRAFLLGPELNAAQKNEFVKYLIYKGNFDLAREVWLSRPGNEADARQPIFDGGFERITESDPSGLGWQIDQAISATAVARDRDDMHSGEHSLNVRFAGNVDLRRPIVSQLAFVQPGRRYTLTFFVSAGELVSAGLPAIVVSDASTKEVLATSQPIQDTDKKWVQQTISFTTPKSSRVIVISLQRPACSTSPCPIFGDLSLDDIVLDERSG